VYILKTFEHFEKINVKDIREYQFYTPPPINKKKQPGEQQPDEPVDEEEAKRREKEA